MTVMVFYDFKAILNQEECFQRLQLAFGDESPCRATVYRWFTHVVDAILFRMKNSQESREILQEANVRGLILHHDIASSHTARLTVEFLKQRQIEVIEHPPYFTDLAMYDLVIH
ncbi:UNVERIFIED_CONTAM: hypothetical protein NCL1_49020 [Trichonephila clavipes]